MIQHMTFPQTTKDITGWKDSDREIDNLANKEGWRVVAIGYISPDYRFVTVSRETPDDAS